MKSKEFIEEKIKHRKIDLGLAEKSQEFYDTSVIEKDIKNLEQVLQDLEILELIKSHCKTAIFMKVLEYHVYRFVETDKEIYNIGRIEPFSKEEIEQLKRWANGK